MTIEFVRDDGGRAQAGFRGITGDCVVRAIAIATEVPYREVYDTLFALSRDTSRAGRARSPRNGVPRAIYDPYLAGLGWQWTPTMTIGSGCQVHLRADELPAGRLIVRLTRHLAAVIDGALHDIADCSRGGERCVYGYWSKEVGGRMTIGFSAQRWGGA